MKTRYFTHVNQFYGGTMFVKLCERTSCCVDADGLPSEFFKKIKVARAFCEQAVKDGDWKEITKKEAMAMLRTNKGSK